MIRDGMPMRPIGNALCGRLVDYLLARRKTEPKQIALAGWSFGGFLASRAAAFEKRIAALVADPGQWDQKPDLRMFHLPEEIVERFPDADPAVFTPVENHLRSKNADAMMCWKIIQRGFRVHEVKSLYDLVRELIRFTEAEGSGGHCETRFRGRRQQAPKGAESQLLGERLTDLFSVT